jgi:hypothetical protein
MGQYTFLFEFLTVHSSCSVMSSDIVLSQGRPAWVPVLESGSEVKKHIVFTYFEQRAECVVSQRLWEASAKRLTRTKNMINIFRTFRSKVTPRTERCHSSEGNTSQHA